MDLAFALGGLPYSVSWLPGASPPSRLRCFSLQPRLDADEHGLSKQALSRTSPHLHRGPVPLVVLRLERVPEVQRLILDQQAEVVHGREP